jgi:hypothetical protein
MQEILKIDINQVLAFAADEGITPSALSPFYAEKPSGRKGAGLDAHSLPLLRTVCEPFASVSARIISAPGVVVLRIYADKTGQIIVRHWIDKDGLHNFRQVQEKDVAAEALLRLMLDIPLSRLDFNAELAAADFCALLGLVDRWRERTLLSLIDRKPGASRPFTVEEIYAAFRRSINSSDLRWLTPLVKELYPGNLDVPLRAFNEGIQGLAPKFAEAGPGGIALTLLGEELCSSLSAPLAASKLSVCGINDGVVSETTMIGLRGMGAFCSLEVSGEDGGSVILQNSSAPMIELYLHTRLAGALQISRESAAKEAEAKKLSQVTPPPPESRWQTVLMPAMKFCPKCGKPLKPGDKSCYECGHKV